MAVVEMHHPVALRVIDVTGKHRSSVCSHGRRPQLPRQAAAVEKIVTKDQ